jgi:DNA ligase (NAD+)
MATGVALAVCAGPALASECPGWSEARLNQEVQALEARMAEWDRAYYQDGQSTIDD